MRMHFAAAAVCAAGLMSGCGLSGEEPSESPAGSAVLISRDPLSKPLAAKDVEAFLRIVEQLPDGVPPSFQPAAIRDLDANQPAAQLVAQWRRDFLNAYLPERQARLWLKNDRLSRALQRQGIDPEALASLLVRLSSAVTRDALDRRVDLVQLHRESDRRIELLCRQLDDPEARNRPGRSMAVLALREATAFREFMALLERPSDESVSVVSRYRESLAKYLPVAETVAAFEQRTETDAVVLPAMHESWELSNPEPLRLSAPFRD